MDLENYHLYDISPLISEDLAVFPGDQPFERSISMDFSKGDHLGLSSICASVHIGAHADAPNHYNKNGVGIDQRELSYYFGKCQVIDLNKVDKNFKVKAPRVLFKTGSYPNPNVWNNDFQSLPPELIKYLHSKEVITVGIDTPSIDPANSKSLDGHSEIYKSNMAILEGIILDQVQEGIYTLIALPLKIKNCDASPVRAILLGAKSD